MAQKLYFPVSRGQVNWLILAISRLAAKATIEKARVSTLDILLEIVDKIWGKKI